MDYSSITELYEYLTKNSQMQDGLAYFEEYSYNLALSRIECYKKLKSLKGIETLSYQTIWLDCRYVPLFKEYEIYIINSSLISKIVFDRIIQFEKHELLKLLNVNVFCFKDGCGNEIEFKKKELKYISNINKLFQI